MPQHCLLWLVFLLYSANQAASKVYHITPTSRDDCTSLLCLSLTQFAINSSEYLSSNTSLVFLPGRHHLTAVDLIVFNVNNFSMTSLSSTAQIECSNDSHIHFNHSLFIQITDLEFIGCGGNQVENVEEFILQNSKFGGQEESETALELFETTAARIINCSFLSNRKGKFKTNVDPYHRPGYVGGALIAVGSTIDISLSSFRDNKATFGGAIFAEKGSFIRMSNNTFSYNTATDLGGVIFSFDSIVAVEGSEFISNTAYAGMLSAIDSNVSVKASEFNVNRASFGGVLLSVRSKIMVESSNFGMNFAIIGGVVYSLSSTISMETSKFHGNGVSNIGGAIYSFTSTVTIDSSEFDKNTANFFGGALYSNISDIKVSASKYENNRAWQGGVHFSLNDSIVIEFSEFENNSATTWGGVLCLDGSTVTIELDVFRANTAKYGGVLQAYTSTITLGESEFSNNTASSYGGVLESESSSVNINGSHFHINTANHGGVLNCVDSDITIRRSDFGMNTALYGGVVYSSRSSIGISDGSEFGNNSAPWGAVVISDESDITIESSNLNNNTASTNGGVLISYLNGKIMIIASTFSDNTAATRGGVMLSFNTSIYVEESKFLANKATFGGVFALSGTVIDVESSDFDSNTALWGGTVLSLDSNFTTKASEYHNNSAIIYGGVMYCAEGSVTITENSTFYDNKAKYGGMLRGENSMVIIADSEFDRNSAIQWGGVLDTIDSTVKIELSEFNANTGYNGGALQSRTSSITVEMSRFHRNSALATNSSGGVLDTHLSNVTIEGCHFANNAAYTGGVMLSDRSNVTLVRCSFHNTTGTNRFGGGAVIAHISNLTMSDTNFTNNVSPIGAVFYAFDSKIKQYNSLLIVNNSAIRYCAVCLVNSEWYGANAMLSNNLGSLVAFNSNITLTGYYVFERNRPPVTTANADFYQFEGGAMTLFQSNVFFNGMCSLEHNIAENGAAILSTESKLYVNGDLAVAHNRATRNGGGIHLTNSEVNCQEGSNITFFGNFATHKGGGIHAISSSIKAISSVDSNFDFVNDTWAVAYLYVIYTGSMLNFTENMAEKGGGLSLEANAKLYVLKYNAVPIGTANHTNTTTFMANTADYGGAVYVDDDTNSGTCAIATRTECFFQVLAIHGAKGEGLVTQSIFFSHNNATISGPILYGGLLDRCAVSQFSEVNDKPWGYNYLGPTYFYNVSTATSYSISSRPVRVCLCENNRQNCDYQKHFHVKKGQTFHLSVVAVDQIGHPVSATIQTTLNFTESGLAEGQLTKEIAGECTDLMFNVVSPHNSETLTLYALDGPCKDSGFSVAKIEIDFLPCSCPTGLQISGKSRTNCSCECHYNISQYVEQCDSNTGSFVKLSQSRAWISYINETTLPGYLLYSNCPFDYCASLSQSIDLNQPNGADSQCAFNRSSLLCGSCQTDLSLSLASSHCLSCPSYWPALFFAIIMVALLAGLGLVAMLLALNMTVAVGTLNGLIFYANIVYANKSILLPFKETNFVTVFVSWLNLELGIDMCFFPGMDTYAKTWLQLAFPAYVILLVVLVIIISSYSIRFSNLIGKKDPVATLATLILLSYAKLLEVCFKSLSVGILEYPDGSRERLWLPDATVKHLSGKHIPLFIVAVLIVMVGLVYTILLFTWQWLLYLPKWRIFNWTKDQRLQLYVETYLIPYTPKHRYWTGLLLLVRAVLYLVAAVNVSNNPHLSLTAIIFSVCCIVLLKDFIGSRMYRMWPVDILETFFHLNMLFFVLFTWYSLSNATVKQEAAAYISVIIAFVVLLFVLLYHVYTYTSAFLFIRKTTLGKIVERFLTKTACPHPKPNEERQSPPPDNDIHRFHEVLDMIDRRVDTNDYNVPLRQHAVAPTHTVVEVHKPQLVPPNAQDNNLSNISDPVEEAGILPNHQEPNLPDIPEVLEAVQVEVYVNYPIESDKGDENQNSTSQESEI